MSKSIRGRGGPGLDLGRKPLTDDQTTIQISATIPASQAAILRIIGDGNLSLGIRRVVDWYERNQRRIEGE